MKKIFAITAAAAALSGACRAATYVYADEYERVYPETCATVQSVPAVCATSEKIGLIRGTCSLVGSVARLVGDTVGEAAFAASRGVDACNIAPERVLTRAGEVLVVRQPSIPAEVVAYREKCVFRPEVFNQIMAADFKEHFGPEFKYLEVRYYNCSGGVLEGEIYATFQDSGDNRIYTIQARAKGADINILKWILREKVKGARARL